MTDERTRAAIEYLQQEPLWHMDMLEALRRGRGEVIFFEGRTVLIKRNDEPESYLLTSEGPDAAEAAFKGVPAPWCVMSRGPGVTERMEARFGLARVLTCTNVAYLKKERLAWDCPGLVIRPFREEELPAFTAHYTREDEDQAREHIRRGELFAAEYQGQLAGFMGLHADGSMGLLQVFPEYRKLGIGRAIEIYSINFCLDRGWIPYGQVRVDNEGSFSLQAHLGMTFDRTKQLCWCFAKE